MFYSNLINRNSSISMEKRVILKFDYLWPKAISEWKYDHYSILFTT